MTHTYAPIVLILFIMGVATLLPSIAFQNGSFFRFAMGCFVISGFAYVLEIINQRGLEEMSNGSPQTKLEDYSDE